MTYWLTRHPNNYALSTFQNCRLFDKSQNLPNVKRRKAFTPSHVFTTPWQISQFLNKCPQRNCINYSKVPIFKMSMYEQIPQPKDYLYSDNQFLKAITHNHKIPSYSYPLIDTDSSNLIYMPEYIIFALMAQKHQI